MDHVVNTTCFVLQRKAGSSERPRALAVVCFLTLCGLVGAQGFGFIKVADTMTTIPGTSEVFLGFGVPSLDDAGNIVFLGMGMGPAGIYTAAIGGPLVVVADAATPIPGQATTFSHGFRSFGASIDEGNIAFYAFTGDSESGCGVYLWKKGTLSVVADEKTPVPGGTGIFGQGENALGFGPFSDPPIDGEDVAFRGAAVQEPPRQRGVYTSIGGKLDVVADLNTPIPSGVGTFVFLSAEISIEGGKVAFQGQGQDLQRGIYTNLTGPLTKVVDKSDAIPGGSGTFASVGYPWFDGEKIVFAGDGPDGQQGIYLWENGALSVVADRNTPIPGSAGTFADFAFNWSPPAANGGSVAFRAVGPDGQGGIYLERGGSLQKVIDMSDTLDGKAVTGLSMAQESLSGLTVAFLAGFADGSSGIYLARPTFRRGDASNDSRCDIADPIFVLNYLFADGLAPSCGDAADANDDGRLDVSDVIVILIHLFGEKITLPVPLDWCGVDCTAHTLGCEGQPACD
jgi:hypothetical protein